MSEQFQRGIFALLCLLCVIAVATGAWLEIARTRRGDNLLAPRHFRLRLISAVVWILALLSLAGAVTIWWPPPHPTDNQRLQLYAVFTGAISLMTIGLLLGVADFWIVSRTRHKVEREQALRFSQQLHELAETETARLRAEQEKTGKVPKVRAYTPLDSARNGTGRSSADAADAPE